MISRLFPFALLQFVVSSLLLPQEKPESPVYKGYREQTPSMLLRRSDATYNALKIFILERRANAGDAAAQHELGLRYLLGEGIRADTVKGAHWIQRAAEQQYSSAQYNMGILSFNGWGVPWNPFEAYRSNLSAAHAGMVEAQYMTAMFLTENLIVPVDWAEAYRWVKRAADGGYGPAKEALSEFEARGLGQDRRSDRGRADSAAMRKTAPGRALGFVFHDAAGDTTTPNDTTLLRDALREAPPRLRRALGLSQPGQARLELDAAALNSIREAAEEGSPEALTILARSYERGIGVRKDRVLAAAYYIRAVRMSSPRAPALLARLLAEPGFIGELRSRVDRDDADARYVWAALAAIGMEYLFAREEGLLTEKQALELLNAGAQAGHLQSMIELGLCYYVGRWVREDREKAIEVWTQAASLGSREASIRLAALSVQASAGKSLTATLDTIRGAVERGSILAQVALGYCYETGAGVTVNKAEAARLYRAAAQRGSQDAYFALRRMHDAIRPKEKEFQLDEL